MVDAFNDPLTALSEFKPRKYDLIMLDIRMPKMSGFELYRGLRQIDEKIRVCFITAFEIYYDEFKRVFPTLKVSCFVRKPVGVKELSSIIRRQLQDAEDRKL